MSETHGPFSDQAQKEVFQRLGYVFRTSNACNEKRIFDSKSNASKYSVLTLKQEEVPMLKAEAYLKCDTCKIWLAVLLVGVGVF